MEVTKVFNNWAEVSDWWSANPKAIRVNSECPDSPCSIETYNHWNHLTTFPTVMTFNV